ncbi:hypothetical protein BV20DRAFT_1054941 [Pilatotrama ljubarskyi]|nr:hypothetical protein BV20DRAFT_1054941 [Pilatotrama ljubarskyi]
MAKRKQTQGSDSSDDEAPVAVSFGTSKKAAKGEQDAVRQFQAAQQLKQKEKNRALDRKLKERAANVKGKGKARDAGSSHWEKATRGKGAAEGDSEGEDGSEREHDDPGRSALEERMARAMREAEEEDSDELDEDEEGSAFEGFSGEGMQVEEGDGEESAEGDDDGEEDEDEDEMSDEEAEGDRQDDAGESDEDEEMGSESEEDEDEEDEQPSSAKRPAQKQNYLPDHLFKSALSSAARNTKIKFADEDSAPSRAPTSPPRKRRHAKRPAKDIILGSRTIRTLPKTSEAITPAAAKALPPPRRVNKFLKHSLNVKGDLAKSKTKGWTRRAANLGVMKRSGPAAHFVRSSRGS